MTADEDFRRAAQAVQRLGVQDTLSLVFNILYTLEEILMSTIVEKMAATEHDQWVRLVKSIMEAHKDSPDGELHAHFHEWEKLCVPYELLPEVQKEKDREFARLAVATVEEFLGISIPVAATFGTANAQLREENEYFRKLLKEFFTSLLRHPVTGSVMKELYERIVSNEHDFRAE